MFQNTQQTKVWVKASLLRKRKVLARLMVRTIQLPCPPSTPALRREEKRPKKCRKKKKKRRVESGDALACWYSIARDLGSEPRPPALLGDGGSRGDTPPAALNKDEIGASCLCACLWSNCELEIARHFAAVTWVFRSSLALSKNKLYKWKVYPLSLPLDHPKHFIGQHVAPAWHFWAHHRLVAIVYLVLVTLVFKHLIAILERKGPVSSGCVFQPVTQEHWYLCLLFFELYCHFCWEATTRRTQVRLAALGEAERARSTIRKGKERLWSFRWTAICFLSLWDTIS